MPNIIVNENELQSASVGSDRIIKIYLGGVLLYMEYTEPKELIDADGKNMIDADGNQILVY